MGTLAIRHGAIITCDERRRILTGGVLLADGERLTAVLEADEAATSPQAAAADIEIDAGGCVVIPGLIDSHAHMQQLLVRGEGDDLPLPRWLAEVLWRSLTVLTPRLWELAAQVACIEMLKSGTTYVFENPLPPIAQADAAAQAIDDAGMRGTVAPIIPDRGYPQELLLDPGETVRQCEAFVQRWHGAAGGRLRAALSPSTPAFSATIDVVRLLAELAQKLGVGFTTHVAESPTTVEAVQKEYGARGVGFFLDELGALGPHTLAVHCVHLLPEEWELFAAAGVHVAHNPTSNMFLGNGIAPVRELLAAGINVSLGCDAPACNNVLDMIAELKTAALAQKARYADPMALSTQQVLDLATRNGARAVGLAGELGSLEPGKLADITVVDMARPHTVPGHRPLSDLIYSATGADVRHVFIGGRQVVQDGRVTTLDEERILADFTQEVKTVNLSAAN